MSTWHVDLLPEQKNAAAHNGSHVCMLAGPGTGKTLTLTRRILHLVEEQDIDPGNILVITFTRAATAELRERITDALAQYETFPRVSTLHAFALRQLLRNTDISDILPQPIRIADDWEQEHIVYQDLKRRLGYNIRTVRERFTALSADWDRLDADNPGWRFTDPRFLGGWQEHRSIFGYTMRSELVYQVKKSLEQSANFTLETEFSHVLVDEYQDLNKCDLAVVKHIVENRSVLFAAGDDDQSIYGFRHAHPQGIRQFSADYNNSEILPLETCMRCDRYIISISEFVANLDPDRIPKNLNPRDGAGDGTVSLVRFQNQDHEAIGIAVLCEQLVTQSGIDPGEILILLRSDRNGSYSQLIKSALNRKGLACSTDRDTNEFFDSTPWRLVRAALLISQNPEDSLAIRCWLQVPRDNNIGDKAFDGIYALARTNKFTFGQAARLVQSDSSVLPRFGTRIKTELERLDGFVSTLPSETDSSDEAHNNEDFTATIRNLVSMILPNTEDREKCIDYLNTVIEESNIVRVSELISALQSHDVSNESAVRDANVSIMTMHKAKGLTSEVVIVPACEDENIPGRQTDPNDIGDERRLLYVSLTRARSHLIITYCERRTGTQGYATSSTGNSPRSLTRFLRDAPVQPVTLSDALTTIIPT